MDQEGVGRKKVILREGPIHYSNVSLVDPGTGVGTRIKYGTLEDGQKVRISVKTGNIIPKPPRYDMKRLNRLRNKTDGPLDTDPELALKKTYRGENFELVYHEFREYIKQKEAKEKMLWFEKEEIPYESGPFPGLPYIEEEEGLENEEEG